MNFDKIIIDKVKSRGLNENLANLIAAQARLESADFTSNVFKQNNNAFGYKYAGQSGATAGTPAPKSEWASPSKPQYYAKYKSVADSANELINWLYRREKEGKFIVAQLQTPAQYANALKLGGYYGSSAASYTNGITAKLKKIDTASGSNILTAGVNTLIIGALVLAAIKMYK